MLCSYFDQLGLSYTKPEGSYFLLVDMSDVQVPESFVVPDFLTQGGRGKDFIKCWWLTQEIGVVAIPPSEVCRIALRLAGSCGEGTLIVRMNGTTCMRVREADSIVLQQGARADRRALCPLLLRKSAYHIFEHESPCRQSERLLELGDSADQAVQRYRPATRRRQAPAPPQRIHEDASGQRPLINVCM